MFELSLFNVAIATAGILGLCINLEKSKMTNRETGEGLLRTRISSIYA